RATRVSVLSKRVLPIGQHEDVTAFLIEYESGPIGVILNSAIGTDVATFAVHGTAGSAWSEDDGSTLYRQAIGESERHMVPVASHDAIAEPLIEFAECVRTGDAPAD